MEKNLKEQHIEEGYGPKYHRTYSIVLGLSLDQAKRALLDLQADMDDCSPQMLASFEKVEGKTRRLKVGDEFQIHIAGPWNGPVRVSEVSDQQFTLRTLDGHLEAGEIVFRLKPLSPDQTIFEIESLARSRDQLVDFFYDKIPIAKAAQTLMWTSFCESFGRRSGGLLKKPSEVEIRTERFDEEAGSWQKI